MIETTKILKSFNEKLKELYPKYKIYGLETKEGYKTPCFSTEIEVRESTYVNKYITLTHIVITCDFLMTTVDTVEQMKVIDTITKNFSKYLKVGDRTLHVTDVSQGYTGDYNDILTFEIDIFAYDNTYEKNMDKPITEVDMRLKRIGD